MLIVEQDEEKIFNFSKIEYIEIAEDDRTIRCEIGNKNIFLGTYASKERAKKVLREIRVKYLEYVKTGGEFNMAALSNNSIRIYTVPKVYQMPKE